MPKYDDFNLDLTTEKNNPQGDSSTQTVGTGDAPSGGGGGGGNSGGVLLTLASIIFQCTKPQEPKK